MKEKSWHDITVEIDQRLAELAKQPLSLSPEQILTIKSCARTTEKYQEGRVGYRLDKFLTLAVLATDEDAYYGFLEFTRDGHNCSHDENQFSGNCFLARTLALSFLPAPDNETRIKEWLYLITAKNGKESSGFGLIAMWQALERSLTDESWVLARTIELLFAGNFLFNHIAEDLIKGILRHRDHLVEELKLKIRKKMMTNTNLILDRHTDNFLDLLSYHQLSGLTAKDRFRLVTKF